MKHMLILAIGNYVPVWLNVTLFTSALFAVVVSILWWTYKSNSTRLASKIMRAISTLLYPIIVVGLVDVALLTLGVQSVVIVGGEGWGDLIAFSSWAVFIIPACYIVGTTPLFVAQHIDRPKHASRV